MASKRLSPLQQAIECISTKENFVLQGGAGSGKTQLLTEILGYISETQPNMKVACITHTNLAADEIKSRVDCSFPISTIHSFLNNFIKDYKKNLHAIFGKLFELELIHREGIEFYENETEQKKAEHIKFKKLYEKFASLLFVLEGKRADKVIGKREYDKNPVSFNEALNVNINQLNNNLSEFINRQDFNLIHYNDTKFNNLHELSYGHDGLLDITSILFEEYPVAIKILQDQFDCIFIDEYQDTNKKIIDILLNKVSKKGKTIIGLYGDSMQAIYSDGIGNVESYVEDNVLKKINKEDNYRCSEQIVEYINKLRTDSLEQTVALKTKSDGAIEKLEERQGSVEFIYSIFENKPNSKSPIEEKEKYAATLEKVIEQSLDAENEFKILRLTNKSIAVDAGFENIFNTFNNRYRNNLETIDRHFSAMQLTELYELCHAYKPHLKSKCSPNYNFVLEKLKKLGLGIRSVNDKKKIKDSFEIILNSNLNLFETIEKAFELKILKKSESYIRYCERMDKKLDELSKNTDFQNFKKLYNLGKNTFARIKNDLAIDEYDFKDFEKSIKTEQFYRDLLSQKICFQEVLNYFNYQNEYYQFMTMHKTKGSGIENVLLVLDEYFWNEYDFRSIYSDQGNNLKRKERSQKLFYVACSRAIKSLKIVRLVEDVDELSDFQKFFSDLTQNQTLKITCS